MFIRLVAFIERENWIELNPLFGKAVHPNRSRSVLGQGKSRAPCLLSEFQPPFHVCRNFCKIIHKDKMAFSMKHKLCFDCLPGVMWDQIVPRRLHVKFLVLFILQFCVDQQLRVVMRLRQLVVVIPTVSQCFWVCSSLYVCHYERRDCHVSLQNVFTQGSLPVSTEQIPWQEDVNCWPHLSHISLPFVEAGVGVLIGGNVPNPWSIGILYILWMIGPLPFSQYPAIPYR